MKNSTNISLFVDYQKCSFTNGIIRYLGTLIFFVGIISTGLSICVFARKSLRRKSCCFYFLILAVSDAIHLLTMFIELFPYAFDIDLIVIHTSICKMIIFTIYFTNHLSNVVLTFASIDRFILIYCPSRSKRICNIKKARWFVSIILLVLFILNGHILIGYEKIHLNENQYSIPSDCNIRKENIFYNNFFRFYDTYIESLFLILIPFVIMFICSLLIIFQIFETRKTIRYNTKGKFYYYTFYTSETIRQTVRKTLNEEGRTRLRDKDIQLCLMLVGTTFAFILFCFPTEINDLFNYTGQHRSCYDWFRKVILMLLQQIYYAGHFYIYTLTGQLFRKHLFILLCGQNYQRIFTQRILNNLDQNQKSKLSITRQSFINTTVHRPTTITIQSNNNNNHQFNSNDPSQRLIPDSKYIIGP